MWYSFVVVICIALVQSNDANVVNNGQRPVDGQSQFSWLVQSQAAHNTQNFINQTLSRIAPGICYKEVP